MKILILVLLVCGVFASAVQLTWVRHKTRASFIELQNLRQQQNQLDIEWGQLQLERSTWAQPGRIEALAREKLQMQVPNPQQIVIIKP